ncbi:hypothetical protein WL99_22330 [Burkholderia cepacia]|uniref:hypothetical protein n=1 Tax=Burkholderia cepacia TaxID=292 RepID=UPI0007565420|nr:hypothetical protein [Burkholderia cepacia]KWH25837.1 hypothetical protein WL99_22330 [Burkholderia cepacia]MDN7442244.1 hypothetical protein [Burkholderia cepacia]
MKTKISIVREHMAAGRWQEAIRVAARFPKLSAERAASLDAHGAYSNPRFFAQLGKDVEALKQAGQRALVLKYSD